MRILQTYLLNIAITVRRPLTSGLLNGAPAHPPPEAAVQYSPLYCAVLNYAASSQASSLGLMAAREQITGQFAQSHRDQLDTLLLDARRLFRRWGPGAMATLERWRAQAGAGGYAGAAEQEAARRALEAAGGQDALNFWLDFDVLGPDLLPGFRAAITALPRGARGQTGVTTRTPIPLLPQQPRPPLARPPQPLAPPLPPPPPPPPPPPLRAQTKRLNSWNCRDRITPCGPFSATCRLNTC